MLLLFESLVFSVIFVQRFLKTAIMEIMVNFLGKRQWRRSFLSKAVCQKHAILLKKDSFKNGFFL